VFAKWSGSQYLREYPGKISAIHGEHYDIDFDDGDKDKRTLRVHIRPVM
jgi:hypothetical protein